MPWCTSSVHFILKIICHHNCLHNYHDLLLFSTDCQLLTDPDNGVISCSLGDDGQASLGDTCNYTCNSGYELSGNVSRSCELNGNWSGTEPTCTRSKKLLMFDSFKYKSHIANLSIHYNNYFSIHFELLYILLHYSKPTYLHMPNMCFTGHETVKIIPIVWLTLAE